MADKKYVAWTGSEIVLLKKIYEKSSKADILIILPRHSWQAIISMAYQLKLKRDRATSWRVKRIIHPYIESLRQKRRSKDLTLNDVAPLAGVGTLTLAQYECGQQVPRLDVLTRWSQALGMTNILTM